MAKDVTLADIAAKVGVSNVAVSKALSGKQGVSDELRVKIKTIADEMGYVSNTTSKPETGNIGVIIPENYYGFSISFYGQLYEKVVRALYDNQYFGILELLTNEDEKAGNIPKVMQDGKVDGLIFLGQMDERYIINMVKQTELPVFFLDTYVPFIELDTVISDGYYGTYQLTNYLIELGHRKIGYVGSVDVTSSIADRYWGYRHSLRENRIAFEPEWEIPDRGENGKLLEKILEEPGDLDAFVCNCDGTAQILIRNLEEAGYRVPEDFSVVGFDNFLPIGMNEHQITSYEVDMERMAEMCVKGLIKKIKHKKYDSGIQIITGRIVKKKTVKSRNKGN
ncbi:LacI family DNA-binding transcriptional regulator [Mediterraneibacter agrestimuris]|uniref:LacI family DNA-binding transcriptional regulator n=1 Tax=Mediterraneibacter agrestimuris TaxID=2941333 RepID=UPI00203C970A|nr:LacI family DNA-binding transcriptional regulator [Mediterraneibacter agrestimuris]